MKSSRIAGVCDFPCDPDAPHDRQSPIWNPRLQPQAVMLSPVDHKDDDTEPILTLAHLYGLDLRRAADGWHGIWQVDGVKHQFWLPEATPGAGAFYAATLPMDSFLELRVHAVRRFWRSLNGRAPGPDFRAIPTQLRQWHILSLRALDARLRGESYRTIAEVLLGFRGTKEDFESDPRKNKARRLVAHGIKMMRGGYRLLLHYPIKPDKR
ncbi:DUF2285 domain-containing protein [Stenotrophomonas maltophilia]|uniref:DUF2285 domain-containing protein n=2 Tax=Pseudomonadota TaxID=1224 RepID=UPI0018EA982D|nr:DUF2285 domain-containing protein [Stenotrophomonas maltophilia]